MSKTATKTAEPKTGAVLSCRAPKATAVYVAGTFNDWNPTATRLTRQADGSWAATLALPRGQHEYKFVVDGQWCCEPGCDGSNQGCPKCVPNSFGTMNCVVEVPA